MNEEGCNCLRCEKARERDRKGAALVQEVKECLENIEPDGYTAMRLSIALEALLEFENL